MTLPELLLEVEARRDRGKGDYAGNLTRGDLDDLRAFMDEGK